MMATLVLLALVTWVSAALVIFVAPLMLELGELTMRASKVAPEPMAPMLKANRQPVQPCMSMAVPLTLAEAVWSAMSCANSTLSESDRWFMCGYLPVSWAKENPIQKGDGVARGGERSEGQSMCCQVSRLIAM